MEFLHQLLNPEALIRTGGYLLLFIIIFAETGLLIGFFLPGDSLLFVAGFLASLASPAAKTLQIEILIPLLCVAAVLGDSTGYFIGRKAGPLLFSRPDSRFFKRSNLDKAHAFYEKHGPKTIILARFVPVVRAFATTVAGAAGMPYRQFLTFSLIGGTSWVLSMSLLGYFLGNVPLVKNNLEKTIMLLILVSISPIILHWLKDREHNKANQSQAGQAEEASAP